MTVHARPALYALVGALVGFFLIGMTYLVVTSFTTTQAIRDTQKGSSRSVEIIEDCTDPGGKCYRRSQERTAAIVGDIGKLAAYASACADQRGVQGQDEVLRCLLDRLRRDSRKSE